MVKRKETTQAAEEAPKAKSPLAAFVEHQTAALEQTGKAFASLLPKEFREHTNRALEEGKAGWEALFEGVIDEVERGLDKLRSTPSDDEPNKVKVEVE
jgi:hypothetical protein